MYAVVIAVVVFLVSWAAIAARPWATPKPDARLVALSLREQRLRADARLVKQVVDQRLAAYTLALNARKAQIATARAQNAASQARTLAAAQSPAPVSQAASAPAVRVVNLPPLTVTRTS
jgi:hypothetical protein